MSYDSEMEKQYSPSIWSLKGENAEDEYARIIHEESLKAVEVVPGRFDIVYGQTDAQKLDLFGEDELPKDAPIFAFVHGGYWVFGCRQDSRYFVPPLFKAGILCCAIGHDLIRESTDSDAIRLSNLVLQIQNAIIFILEYARKRGSRGVYVCGHSAGGHLITMALSLENSQLKKNSNLIKGVIPVSGIFDLQPLLATSYSTSANITEEIVRGYSPSTAVSILKDYLDSSASVYVVVAQHDSPAFKQQSETYSKAVEAAGVKCIFEVLKDEDHFTIVEKLTNAEFSLTKKLIHYIQD